MRDARAWIFCVAALGFACGDDGQQEPDPAGPCDKGIPSARADVFVSQWANDLGDNLSFTVERASVDEQQTGVCSLVADVTFDTSTEPPMRASDVVIAFQGPDKASFKTTVKSMPNESGVSVALPLEALSDGTSWVLTTRGVRTVTTVLTDVQISAKARTQDRLQSPHRIR